MIRVPGLLLIGAAERKLGKTGLTCDILRRFTAQFPVAAIKATVISDDRRGCHRPDGGCGSCAMAAPFEIIEETDPSSPKDTARMLSAGASRVFWLKTRMAAAPEAVEACLKRIGPGIPIVCESNRLRKFVEPDVFLMLMGANPEKAKPTARSVEEHVDGFVGYEGDGSPHEISLHTGTWRLRTGATAIVLAGGRSSRMGRDKSLLPVQGRPLIECLLQTLHPSFSRLMISANDPDKYRFADVPVIADRLPGQGPLMGIASALEASRTELNFIIACDIPQINIPLMMKLMRLSSGFDAVIPVHQGFPEPLFAVYRNTIAPILFTALNKGVRKITQALEPVRIRFVELSDEERIVNLNTPEEVNAYEKECHAHA